MPIHEWRAVEAGIFHDFRQSWSVRIKDALNAGLLPDEYAAMIERRSGGEHYAERANRIVVRQGLGRVVAVVEIVSPGNKASRAAVKAFVEKVQGFLSHDVHVLIIDLFPPGPHDPEGLHKLIWDERSRSPSWRGRIDCWRRMSAARSEWRIWNRWGWARGCR